MAIVITASLLEDKKQNVWSVAVWQFTEGQHRKTTAENKRNLLKLIEFRKAARNKIGIQVSIGFIIFVKSLENIMKKILVHQ